MNQDYLLQIRELFFKSFLCDEKITFANGKGVWCNLTLLSILFPNLKSIIILSDDSNFDHYPWNIILKQLLNTKKLKQIEFEMNKKIKSITNKRT